MTPEKFKTIESGILSQVAELQKRRKRLIEQFVEANTLPVGMKVRHDGELVEILETAFSPSMPPDELPSIVYMVRLVRKPHITKSIVLGSFEVAQ